MEGAAIRGLPPSKARLPSSFGYSQIGIESPGKVVGLAFSKRAYNSFVSAGRERKSMVMLEGL